MSENRGPVKIILVTGYLGAGKTTLLNHILSNDRDLRAAVIVNDIGEVNIDEGLIREGGLTQGDSVIPLTNGCICCSLSEDLAEQLADIADTVVGRGVHLDDVVYALVVYAAAYLALVARVAVLRMQAVDRFGEYARAGGLAYAARTGEEIGVGKSSGLYLLFEYLGDLRLAENVGKLRRPVFSVKDLVHTAASPVRSPLSAFMYTARLYTHKIKDKSFLHTDIRTPGLLRRTRRTA